MPSSATHTVRSGETLSKIAAKHGVDLGELVRLNKIANPNAIKVGQVLQIPASGSAVSGGAGPTSGGGASTPASGHELGGLSAKFETSGRGPGTVSGGVGDPGGVSYGSYQLASKLKRPEEFLAREGARWAGEFGGARSGTPAFTSVWKAIAKREGPAFHAAQHDFIKRTHYDVQVAHVLNKTGVDLDKRSNAVRDCAWSTAVQHGPSSGIIVNALGDKKLEDRELLSAIYAERGRKGADGKLAHFRRASAAVQAGVAQRFRDELRDALKMLGGG